MIKMFFDCVVKGVIMTLTFKDGSVVKGQYELTTEKGQVCLFTDRLNNYEYFDIEFIQSVLVEEE